VVIQIVGLMIEISKFLKPILRHLSTTFSKNYQLGILINPLSFLIFEKMVAKQFKMGLKI
jgi:hypothetical protein